MEKSAKLLLRLTYAAAIDKGFSSESPVSPLHKQPARRMLAKRRARPGPFALDAMETSILGEPSSGQGASSETFRSRLGIDEVSPFPLTAAHLTWEPWLWFPTREITHSCPRAFPCLHLREECSSDLMRAQPECVMFVL